MEQIERVLEISSLFGVISTFIIFFNIVADLPPHIPIHFGIDGKADWFIDNIWASPFIPLLSLGIYIFIIYRKDRMKFPFKITETNSFAQKRLAKLYAKWMGCGVSWLLCWIEYNTLDIASGLSEGISQISMIGFLSVFLISTAWYFLQAWINK